MRPARVVGVLGATLVIAACAYPGRSDATPSREAVPAPSTTSSAGSPTLSSLAGPNATPDAQAAVAAVLTEAASHLGVSTDQLQVVQVDGRQWPDSSLGCPQPGNLYSQIVTPGYLVIVTSGGKQLEYHTDTRDRVVLCSES